MVYVFGGARVDVALINDRRVCGRRRINVLRRVGAWARSRDNIVMTTNRRYVVRDVLSRRQLRASRTRGILSGS